MNNEKHQNYSYNTIGKQGRLAFQGGIFFVNTPQQKNPLPNWQGVLLLGALRAQSSCVSLRFSQGIQFAYPARRSTSSLVRRRARVSSRVTREILGYPIRGAFCFWALARVIVLNFTIGTGKPLLRIALTHRSRFAAFSLYRFALRGLSYRIFSVAVLHF